MKILSLRLKSIFVTAAVLLAVTVGVFFMASIVNEAVSADDRLIPIYNVDTDSNKVAVTFNCAMSGDIDRILAILDDYNVKCTFFLLGSWAESHTDELKAIYEAEHEIGNHSYSHNDMPSMSYEDIILDIQKCNDIVKSITGYSPTLFRAPSGSYNNKTISAAEELGMTTIQWDADSVDWKNISAGEILERVTSKVGSGSIIQLHSGTEHTAEALPELLDYLTESGYIPVTVSELIYHTDYKINSNGTQVQMQ
ncbi:MAG: polysaccharide deacetylase family protein [Clostridia bacterium]|nr:polysaccharide deacetylase family protein [Clostridia bacterium]